MIETNNINDALNDKYWVNVMHEKLDQFVRNNEWELVEKPNNVNFIGTKWIFKNKTDKFGVIVRNEAGLVAKGYIQVGG